MKYEVNDHTFAICAYKENEFLETCIQSLIKQTVKTNIIMCTSTPNDFIKALSAKYQITLHTNPKGSGLASDWNFAVSCANTSLVTLCHQDDYYYETYAETVLKHANECDRFIMAYTNYEEDKNGMLEHDNLNLKIKNVMNAPMRFKGSWKHRFVRRRILSLGNPICCPSVTFNKEAVTLPLFNNQFKNAADWDAWERLSKLKGSVVYCKEYLMAHRVHENSTTTLNIQNNVRSQEDLVMFQRFWPNSIAKVLTKVFKYSEKNNSN